MYRRRQDFVSGVSVCRDGRCVRLKDAAVVSPEKEDYIPAVLREKLIPPQSLFRVLSFRYLPVCADETDRLALIATSTFVEVDPSMRGNPVEGAVRPDNTELLVVAAIADSGKRT